ncbi:MAG: sulfotransferase family 2 domain-containing protein [Phycisphaerales bacterium]|nr:sulfotransferase family 2 domain-containing protein [Phycisphaerales bacterium]
MQPRLTRPLIFVHIFKAGGTSLRKIIRQNNKGAPVQLFNGNFGQNNEWRARPQDERDSFGLLLGHQHYGNHEYLSAPASYMTVLRDPIDRVISYYYFVLRYKDHHLYKHGFTDDTTLSDFVHHGRNIELDNIQTRLLNPQPEKQYPFGSVDQSMLDIALENLEKIDRVGIVERMGDFLELLRQAEGWTIETEFHENRTADRPRVHDHDESVLERIRELNRFDIALHEAARKRFEREWTECLAAVQG